MTRRRKKPQATRADILKALGIDTPTYRTVNRRDGTVQITTRDGMFTWRPADGPDRKP